MSSHITSWVYNQDKGLGVISWQPSLTGIYIEPVLDKIRYKQIGLGRAQVWDYEKAYLERNTRRYNNKAEQRKYLREIQ